MLTLMPLRAARLAGIISGSSYEYQRLTCSGGCCSLPLISTAVLPILDLDLWPWLMTLTLAHDLDPDPDLWSWPWPLTLTLRQCNSDVNTQILAFDLDLWSSNLTFNPNLAKVKVNIQTKYQCCSSNRLGMRALMDSQTDGRTNATKRIISLLCGR